MEILKKAASFFGIQYPRRRKRIDVRQKLLINQNVLKQLQAYRQKKAKSSEAGGQLFATINQDSVCIEEASVPHRSDRRARFDCVLDNNRCNREIQDFFKRGLHYVGDWHTHPQSNPSPSSTDIRSMQDCFRRSDHQLNYLVMMIVGTREMDFYVALVNNHEVIELDGQQSGTYWNYSAPDYGT